LLAFQLNKTACTNVKGNDKSFEEIPLIAHVRIPRVRDLRSRQDDISIRVKMNESKVAVLGLESLRFVR
jgi:hypothetical protein